MSFSVSSRVGVSGSELKRRLVRDRLWQEDKYQALASPLLAQCPVNRGPKHR